MNENINLCEILKGHEGEEFYCSFLGCAITLTFIKNDKLMFDVIHPDRANIELCSNGAYYLGGEIQLFPSKNQRDWLKWNKENNHKTPKTWSELENSDYFTDIFSNFDNNTPIGKSALAFLKIYQLIETSYGGNVSHKYIFINLPDFVYDIIYNNVEYKFKPFPSFGLKHSPIMFHTEKQAEEFLSYPENIQLLKDYFMMYE